MDRIPDHPVIRMTEKTGYATKTAVAHQCSVCGEPIYVGESAYNIRGYGWVCEHCADLAYEVAE